MKQVLVGSEQACSRELWESMEGAPSIGIFGELMEDEAVSGSSGRSLGGVFKARLLGSLSKRLY